MTQHPLWSAALAPTCESPHAQRSLADGQCCKCVLQFNQTGTWCKREISSPPLEVHHATSLINALWNDSDLLSNGKRICTFTRKMIRLESKTEPWRVDSSHLVKLFSQVTNYISVLQAAEHLSGDDTWNTTQVHHLGNTHDIAYICVWRHLYSRCTEPQSWWAPEALPLCRFCTPLANHLSPAKRDSQSEDRTHEIPSDCHHWWSLTSSALRPDRTASYRWHAVTRPSVWVPCGPRCRESSGVCDWLEPLTDGWRTLLGD